MSWSSDYRWLDAFWREVVAGRSRRWVLGGLLDRDLFVRDALAHAVLRERLAHERRDVRCQFVHPFSDDPPIEPPGPKEDLLIVGRPKGYGGTVAEPSILRPLVGGLEPPGRFIDPDEREFGGAVVYAGKLFRRHDLEVAEPYTRCDVDYAILYCRRVKTDRGEHLVIALAGLSTFGTLGLALILTHDARRKALARQVRELLPWRAGLRPDVSTEICVRISVAGVQQLAQLPNRLEFAFRVDAVVIASQLPGVEFVTQVRKGAEPELVLIPDSVKKGGVVRLPGEAEVKLPQTRFELLRSLVEQQAEATLGTVEELRPAGRKKAGRAGRGGGLAKLVHDLNASLRTLPGLEAARPVRFTKKDARYTLVGVRGSLLGARSSRSSRRRRRRRPRRRDS